MGLVNLAPGAEEAALAMMLSEIIESNLRDKPQKLKDFNKLKTRVYINAYDADLELTLVFNKGELTVHNGNVGQPNISTITDSGTLLDLTNLKIKAGIPWFFDENGREVTKKMLSGKLKIHGLVTRLLPIIRLTKAMSVQ